MSKLMLPKECVHTLKHNKELNFVFCVKCGERWTQFAECSHTPYYPNTYPMQPWTCSDADRVKSFGQYTDGGSSTTTWTGDGTGDVEPDCECDC